MLSALILATASQPSSQSVTPAIIAASASLVVAIVTAAFSWRNSVALKKLEAEQAKSNAKIAYDYEARKRLYTVCEPLLFQAMEQAEDARSRIRSLATAARNGDLRPDGSGWLNPPQRYYFKSTVYSLLAPITTFNILQRRLTTIDLSLDTSVRTKYEMLRLIFFSFAKDWELAACGGAEAKLKYDRNKTDPGEPDRERHLRDSPAIYAPQGLFRGMLYVVAEALVSGETKELQGGPDAAEPPERCMTFGEFEREWDRAEAERSSRMRRALDRIVDPRHAPSPMTPVFDNLVELFGGFHPMRKPVLWRVLIAQYLLYRALPQETPTLEPLTAEEIQGFDWRGKAAANEDFRKPLSVAEEFVVGELATMRERLEK